ncbi:hypothetical protein Tco_0832983 [Tanacetum coccineum]
MICQGFPYPCTSQTFLLISQNVSFRIYVVSNSKNLINSLSNIWIGKLQLYANVARRNTNVTANLHPAIVLDEACFMECDFSSSLMGKIKDINALPNVYLILSNEGFENVIVTHLGEMWVLLDMSSIATKDKIHKHVGIGSWFTELKPACNSFVSDERITWISIEGLPITTMTRNTCDKIVSSWGEIIDVDEPECMTLSFKKLCVKVKSHVTINDKVKVIVKGEVFWIHIKELEPWVPKFTKVKDDDSSSENEIDGEDNVNQSDSVMDNDDEVDYVSESSCMNEYGNDRMPKKAPSVNEHATSVKSDDPFGIYKILKRDITKVASESVDPQFPPGFTPDVVEVNFVEDANPIPVNVA